jgi:hypothetical protein
LLHTSIQRFQFIQIYFINKIFRNTHADFSYKINQINYLPVIHDILIIISMHDFQRIYFSNGAKPFTFHITDSICIILSSNFTFNHFAIHLQNDSLIRFIFLILEKSACQKSSLGNMKPDNKKLDIQFLLELIILFFDRIFDVGNVLSSSLVYRISSCE